MTIGTHITASGIEVDRRAFNAAFYALGLRWHWDDVTYEALAALPGERERVQRYLHTEQAHLLRAYDAEFLVDAILEAKARCQPLAPAGGDTGRPGARLSHWADAHWGEVGI